MGGLFRGIKLLGEERVRCSQRLLNRPKTVCHQDNEKSHDAEGNVLEGDMSGLSWDRPGVLAEVVGCGVRGEG